ncbi:MAG TPA: DUF4126 domain-containing protein [Alphaproteobacteria bacterium]|nr:DUF4126 domain-containing protein [Alphaproteobacteria bacterium]
MVYLAALLIGVICGLRAFMGPTAVSWAARLGWLPVEGSWAAFMGYAYTPFVWTVLQLVEFVTDQLPQTPSRKVPVQFGARLVSGGFSGAVIGTAGGSLIGGLVAGIVGAVIGTFGGAELRGRMAKAFGNDRPAALIEDAIAIIGAFLIVHSL